MHKWGCLPIMLFFVLVLLCPPLGLVFAFGYIWYLNFGKTNSNISGIAWLYIIAILFILIASPIVFWLEIVRFGIAYPFKESPVIAIITILEVALMMVYVIANFFKKDKKE